MNMFSFLKKDYKVINVNDLAGGDTKNLIDIREPAEYKSGHVPGAKNIPMQQLLNQPEKYLSKDTNYKIVCQSGGRSSRACDALSKAGYDVTNVAGGTGYFVGPLER
jgi:rhodanese-related sulfurtransferase